MSARPLGTVRVMAQEHGAERARPSAEVPEEYRAIFEAVTDGLVITDLATGRIVEVNPALCRMHGYQRDGLVGSLTTTIIHPGDHPVVHRLRRRHPALARVPGPAPRCDQGRPGLRRGGARHPAA